jgi:hypothetical protein
MYTGPKLHNDQLVFGYDTGYGLDQHSSTRHYKGEPATNVIADGIPGYFGSGGETLYRSNYYGLNSDSGVFQRNFVSNPATANTSAFNNNAGLYKSFPNATLSSSTEYVLVSFDFYMITPYVRHSSSTTGLNGYMGIRYTDGSTDNLGWNTALNTPNAGDDWNNNSAYIGQWRKIALYVDLNDSKTPSFISAMYIYNDRTITGEGIFTNFIITEHTTIPTGPVNYTSGTRSNTQSLIDLKSTTDIDVSTLSFDSIGQPVFDGTNDYLQLNAKFLPTIGAFTMEFLYQISTTGGRGGMFERNPSSPYNGALIGQGGTGSWYFQVSNGSQSLTIDDMGYPSTNTWYHDVGVYDGVNTIKFYRNGSLHDTVTGSTIGNIDSGGSRDNMRFMKRDNNSNTIGGKVAISKVYNKVLSDAEVKQNYNAYKNRFNI